jgi:hypothetical protein
MNYDQTDSQTKENAMKTLLAIFGILTLIALLTACGPQDVYYTIPPLPTPTPTATPNPSPTPQPTATPIPAGTYISCVADNPNRVLPVWLITSGATVESCVSAGEQLGYPYVGLEYGGQCFAGFNPGDTAADCNMPCAANNNEICGGYWAESVYYTGTPALQQNNGGW